MKKGPRGRNRGGLARCRQAGERYTRSAMASAISVVVLAPPMS